MTDSNTSDSNTPDSNPSPEQTTWGVGPWQGEWPAGVGEQAVRVLEDLQFTHGSGGAECDY